MKHLLSMILAAVLCFGVAVLPAAAEDATAPEPVTQTQEETAEAEPVTQTQEEPAEPEPTAQTPEVDPAIPAPHKPLSPYRRPDQADYDGAYTDYWEDLGIWQQSIYASYYYWRSPDRYGRPQYNKAYRAFYADDPDLLIQDHFVFIKREAYTYENKKRVKRTFSVILDYFDTDEAEQACTTLRIPATLDGCKVLIEMCYALNDDTDATASIGYNNNVVKKLVLEEGLTGVSSYAFSAFTALKVAYLPASMTAVPIGMFRGCTSLKKVVARGTLETIGARAFEDCTSLRTFDALETVKYLHGRAFANSGLRSVTLYGAVMTGFGDEDLESSNAHGACFADCKKLKTVCFADLDQKEQQLKRGLAIYWYCFSGCTALDTVTLPLGVSRIDIYENAFAGCTALRAVQHVACLKTVYNNAFLNCKTLDTFVLPKEIEFAEADAFKGCTALNRFFVNSKNANLLKYKDYDDGDYRGRSINGNFLASLPKDCTIFVVNKEMKYVFKTTGFKGAVKIRVNVPTPKTARMTKQNGKVRFVWSTVTKADGYRIWSYDAKTGKYTRLATVKAPKTSVTLKSGAKRFVIRAYRIETGDVSWSAKKAFR